MPWKETCALKERESFILAACREDKPFSGLCEEFGISRKTGYKWLERYEAGGLKGLFDGRGKRSSFARVFDKETFETVLELRRMKPRWGPLKLSAYLRDAFPGGSWPSPGTIKIWLRKEGLSRARKRRRSVCHEAIKRELMPITASNDVWCADFKGCFRTGDGKICEPLTVIDGYSRYLLCCKTTKSKSHVDITGEFEKIFRECGRPSVIRSDNGSPFGSTGLGKLSRLAVWFIKQGILPERIRPGHPEENSRQERFHRTLKEETATPPAKKLGFQQIKFDRFREEYNNQRPHEALGQRPPAKFYVPGKYEPAPNYEYPQGMTVRRVNYKGYVNIGGRFIYISESLAQEHVGFVKVGEDRYRVEFLGYPVAIVVEDYPLGCYL